MYGQTPIPDLTGSALFGLDRFVPAGHVENMEALLGHYRQLTIAIETSTGASDSLLHLHGGLVILFLARVVTRRSLATWTPFLFVLAAALLKELADRLVHGSWRMPDTAFDIINTIFWPLVLMIGLRWRRAHPNEAIQPRQNETSELP